MTAFKQREAICGEAQSDVAGIREEFMIEFYTVYNYRVVTELSVMHRIKYIRNFARNVFAS